MTNKTKAFVFDFDDTLAVTVTAIKVLNKDGMVVNRLTSEQFSKYEPLDGDTFDFSDFTNVEQIVSATPRKLIDFACTVAMENHSIYILTARRNAVAGAIHLFLALFGITATVICVGDRGRETASYKADELRAIEANHSKVYFYDDDEKNLAVARTIGIRTIKATH